MLICCVLTYQVYKENLMYKVATLCTSDFCDLLFYILSCAQTQYHLESFLTMFADGMTKYSFKAAQAMSALKCV